MELTIHLVDEGNDVGSVLRDPQNEDEVQMLRPTTSLRWDFLRQLTLLTRHNNEGPEWVSYLREGFDLAELSTVSHSAVLFADAGGRLFALTFGNGRALLDTDALVRDFGLWVTANSLEPGRVVGLGSRTFRLRPRRRMTRLADPSGIADFDVKLDVEWVQMLAGRPLGDDVFRAVHGSDSLHVTLQPELRTLDALPLVLDELAERYEATTYREHFAFLDDFRALRRSDPRVAQLDSLICSRLGLLRDQRLGIGAPQALDDLDDKTVHAFEISGDGRPTRHDDLQVDTIRMRRSGPRAGPDPLRQLKITPLNAADERLDSTRPLRDYLVCTELLDDREYALSTGTWFELGSGFVTALDTRVRELPVIDFESVI